MQLHGICIKLKICRIAHFTVYVTKEMQLMCSICKCGDPTKLETPPSPAIMTLLECFQGFGLGKKQECFCVKV